jgi:ankyrin repeat protein
MGGWTVISANEIEYWASVGNVERVRIAIQAGHDVNARSENGYTALHAAAENNHVDVIVLLKANAADLNARLDSGETARDLAVSADCHEAARLLDDWAISQNRDLDGIH